MQTINERGDGVLIIRNKRGKGMTKLRLKKYPQSGNVFMSLNQYENGEQVNEVVMSLTPEFIAKLKEWL